MKNSLKIFLGLTILFWTSCSESFLDEKYIQGESTDVFQTQEGIDKLSVGLYFFLEFPVNYDWGFNLYNLGVDEFTFGGSASLPYDIYNASLNSTHGSVRDLWNKSYAAIESANLILKYAPKVYDTSLAAYNSRLAEAYFFRAYFHQILVANYGGIPLQAEAQDRRIKTYFPRNTPKECYSFIISDLEQAYKLVSDNAAVFGRINKTVVAHYLAKAHLYRASEINDDWNSSYVANDLDAVFKYADEVIAKHPLANNFTDLWNYDQVNAACETNPEIVFSVLFDDNKSTDSRFRNQIHLGFASTYSSIPGFTRDIGGGRDFSRLRTTNYAMDAYDRVNDSRFWKSFRTTQVANKASAAPKWLDVFNNDASTIDKSRFADGEVALKYIINDAGDSRYTGDEEKVPFSAYKAGVAQAPYTLVRYFDGEQDSYLKAHGNMNSIVLSARFPSLNKYYDGSRDNYNTAYGNRDFVLARSAEDYLFAAEAYIRKGKVQNAIPYFNALRKRAAYKEGEDRTTYVDGGVAYRNNPYFDGEYSAYSDFNTYYESNYDMAETTTSTEVAMSLTSVADIENSTVDSKIHDAIVSAGGKEDVYMAFLLNERTRELCGELHRWADLVRTKTLESRWKAFNDGQDYAGASFNPDVHYYRPIPQTFIDLLTNESGSLLSDSEKSAYQNPGY
ncbi:MAG: RagB/SusD family nutrient uptake outer membrane protein [Bacteroidales bacterium]